MRSCISIPEAHWFPRTSTYGRGLIWSKWGKGALPCIWQYPVSSTQRPARICACWLAEGREQASTSGASERLEETGIPLRRGMRRCTWPASRALQPQEEIRWPLWVHPRDRGPFSFHLSFYYEPLTPVEGMQHRCEAPPAMHRCQTLSSSQAVLALSDVPGRGIARHSAPVSCHVASSCEPLKPASGLKRRLFPSAASTGTSWGVSTHACSPACPPKGNRSIFWGSLEFCTRMQAARPAVRSLCFARGLQGSGVLR